MRSFINRGTRIAYQPDQRLANEGTERRYQNRLENERLRIANTTKTADASMVNAQANDFNVRNQINLEKVKSQGQLDNTALSNQGQLARQKLGFNQDDKVRDINHGRALTSDIISGIKATGDDNIFIPDDIAGKEAMRPGLASRVGQMAIDQNVAQTTYDRGKDQSDLMVKLLKATQNDESLPGVKQPEDPLHKEARTKLTNILTPGASAAAVDDLLGVKSGGGGDMSLQDALAVANNSAQVNTVPALNQNVQPNIPAAPSTPRPSIVSKNLVDYRQKSATAHERFVQKKKDRATSRSRGLDALRKRTMERAGRTITRNQ